jgi:thymidylate synthase
MKTEINLISSVYYYNEKLYIGYQDETQSNLIFNVKDDLEYFKNMTLNNVVIMGYKTWVSMNKRILNNRINIILTKKEELIKLNKQKDIIKNIDNFRNKNCSKLDDYIKYKYNKIYFVELKMLENIMKKCEGSYWVIGGSYIFNEFIKNEIFNKYINKFYITEMKFTDDKLNDEKKIEIKSKLNAGIYILPELLNNFKLIGYSDKKETNCNSGLINLRFLIYKWQNEMQTNNNDYVYSELLKKILRDGINKLDRTKIGTKSIFGDYLEFDSSLHFPIITKKRVYFKGVVEELLWFLRGETDSKVLEEKGVNIWKDNTSRKFLDERGLDYDVGLLGKGYGWQIRNFGGKNYSVENRGKIDNSGFDQLEYILDSIKKDPDSRRILMSYWNPLDFNETALLPCHILFQVYIENGYLHGLWFQRSVDVFLGLPFNISSYSLLLNILALKTNLKAGKIKFFGGDIHIYKNHLETAEKFLKNNSRINCMLSISEKVKTKKWEEITCDDFELIGYFPNKNIKAKMAV